MMKKALLAILIASLLVVLISCDKNLPIEDIEPTVYAPPEEVRVISINLDGNTPTIEGRAKILIPNLLSYEPDSIGAQEVIYTWGETLETMLGNKYGRIGVTDEGHVQKAAASAVYIYYNKEKFNVIADGTVWLTQTPSRPAGRTCTWAVFENKETGFRYAHVNTHLEWADDGENRYQMGIIRDICQQLTSLGFPVFATGDFNTSEGSDSYEIMTSTDFMFDSKFLATETMDIGTFHGGNPNPIGKKPIDFCFVSGKMMDVHKYEVINSVIDYDTFMSDHNGLFVRATVFAPPDQLQFDPIISTDGISISSADVRPYVIDLKFTVANDDFMIDKYRVAAVDKTGNEIVVREIPSRHFDYDAPVDLNCTLPGLSPGEKYTVNISPMTLVGTYGTPFSVEFITPEN